ncbi:uncharacterized protein LOC132680820 [Panthera onca]|uniref:uncharacterized protein LOC132680820 n=1 Tax=Panthera onca TaxID=9690 RepID=UPI0029548963|nr:uncharacterized protein LOC132680820 [Panthera onca]
MKGPRSTVTCYTNTTLSSDAENSRPAGSDWVCLLCFPHLSSLPSITNWPTLDNRVTGAKHHSRWAGRKQLAGKGAHDPLPQSTLGLGEVRPEVARELARPAKSWTVLHMATLVNMCQHGQHWLNMAVNSYTEYTKCSQFELTYTVLYDPGRLLDQKDTEAIKHTKPGFVTTCVFRRTLALSGCASRAPLVSDSTSPVRLWVEDGGRQSQTCLPGGTCPSVEASYGVPAGIYI